MEKENKVRKSVSDMGLSATQLKVLNPLLIRSDLEDATPMSASAISETAKAAGFPITAQVVRIAIRAIRAKGYPIETVGLDEKGSFKRKTRGRKGFRFSP